MMRHGCQTNPRRVIVCPALILVIVAALGRGDDPPTLQAQLHREGPAALAKAARQHGDPRRGALVFHRPELTCTRCHSAGEGLTKLGPDLAEPLKGTTDVHLVESVLSPSKDIRKGFESVVVVDKNGRTLTGLLAEERADAVVLRDADQDGKLTTVLNKDIDARTTRGQSLMPEGLVNVLSSRQEFLDLTRYLMEIADKGALEAGRLRPAASLFAPPPLPAYERDLDHAGLLRELDVKSYQRGEAIYTRVCANCHGTLEQLGSMPTSLRFAEGKFKNGADPYRLYHTLTHGYGQMTPQSWMVPQQKYDVIHYLREKYLRAKNPTQYVRIDENYLAALPRGKSRGPKPSTIEPWVSMDYGPSLMLTLEVGDRGNFAYKGIAVRLDHGPGGVSRGRHWMLYDHDTLRVAAAWQGEGFIDWNGINFNGRHQVHPRTVGPVAFANDIGPGWAKSHHALREEPRLRGRDGKPYGPLPRDWAQYRGLYHFGNQVILDYTVAGIRILETPAFELTAKGEVVYTRIMNIGKAAEDLVVRLGPAGIVTTLLRDGEAGRGILFGDQPGFRIMHIPAAVTPINLKILLGTGDEEAQSALAKSLAPPASLEPFTRGGPRRWPELLKTKPILGEDSQAFAVDILTLPEHNPWNCQLRLTGFDFFADGRRAAVCTWDGDVWLVDGLHDLAAGLTWQRIACGLFQPLGLKIVRDKIHVSCRDQIVILHDLNGDGETDYYECFNNDHQVTEHFHEFAMGLQTDVEGHFYYSKAARHALKAVVPQHGTLLRVSKDGQSTSILATGFRAPNGVCLNLDGTFFMTDQEGFWLPKNRINRVERGSFHGNMWGYHDVTDTADTAMASPVCWITNAFDRSPGEPLWVTSDRWGPLKGSLLNLSYGNGKVFVVPHEQVDGVWQGGMVALPIPAFPTGLMRGRFHPQDGQLYGCGMFAWAGDRTLPGGFYRIRSTGKPVHVPIRLNVAKEGMLLTFTDALDYAAASNPKNYIVKTWALKRSEQYGSKHYDEKTLSIKEAIPSHDRKSVLLSLADHQPVWCMEIQYNLKSHGGTPVEGVIHNTIHRLRK